MNKKVPFEGAISYGVSEIAYIVWVGTTFELEVTLQRLNKYVLSTLLYPRHL